MKMTSLQVTMEDEGSLPDGMISPFRFFVSGKAYFEKDISPLHLALLPTPPYWEIREWWSYGEIWNTHGKCGMIRFYEPWQEHMVKQVEWLSEGKLSRVDHYDVFGKKYCSDYYFTQDRFESRTYFDENGAEKVTFQPEKDIFTLIDKGQTLFFSREEFLRFFRNLAEKEGLLLAEK